MSSVCFAATAIQWLCSGFSDSQPVIGRTSAAALTSVSRASIDHRLSVCSFSLLSSSWYALSL